MVIKAGWFLHRINRDQYNRTGNQETNLCVHVNWFSRALNRRKNVFSTNGVETNEYSHVKEHIWFLPIQKVNLEWIQALTLLRENIWEELHDIELGNVFLNRHLKHKQPRGKNRYLAFYHNEKKSITKKVN